MDPFQNKKISPKWYQVVSIVLEVCQYINPLQITDVIGVNRAFATAITKQLPAASWAVVAENSNAHTATVAPLLRTLVPRYEKVRVFSQSSLRNSFAVQHIVVTDVVGRPLVWLAHCPTSEVTPSLLWNITRRALTTSKHNSSTASATTTINTGVLIPALASVVHQEYTAEITSLDPKDVSLMINGKRASANSTTPLSEMKWMSAGGGRSPTSTGLPRGADVWVVVRGYDSIGDVTVTLNASAAGPSWVGGDQGYAAAMRARCMLLQETVGPIDFEAACLSLFPSK